ncbi:MAG TPA: hypothetical protein ENH05_07740 [Rhizobiales bacterium]|nr:hypothetical protein BMS3Bbin10_00711 [bacterium BMS3Bbin10]HDO52613.1 hypothetical protein [Hyphomicrobiales bacterium]
MERKNIDLETFLESLPAEGAANARAAAARIDELERAAQRIGRSERRYIFLFAGAGLLGLAAAVMTFGGYHLFGKGNMTLGDVVVLAMAGAFPILILVYSLRMRERTKIDSEKFKIIETFFLPFDGIYFPPGPEQKTGTVSVSPRAKAWRRPNTRDAKKARAYW